MAKYKEIYIISSHTKRIFANMRRQGQGFSKNITPLFETMMVNAQEEVGEGSGLQTDSHHTPTDTQPSSSKPQKKMNPKRNQRQAAEVHLPSSEITVEESILTPSNDPLPSGEDSIQLNELMIFYTSLQQQVLDLEEAKIDQAKEIAKLKKIVKKLENKRKSRPAGLRRLKKVGSSRQVESSEEKDSLGAHEDASKQGRSIEDIDQDAEIALVDVAHERMNDAYMFGVDDFEGNEVIAEKEVSTADPVTTTSEVVTDVSVEDSTGPTTATTADDKGKAKMIELEKPLKKKDQIALDEEVARKLEAEIRAKMEEKERIAREKDEANRAVIEEWDDVQATIDADMQRKYFAAKRAKEIRNKPPTKAQQKSLMCTYMRNMEGFKQKDFKGKSFDDIKKIFDKKAVSKRAGQELEQESTKKHKLAEQEQAKGADDDTAKLKRSLEIVPKDDDDVAIKATPLSYKSPTIVDYKIYREGKKRYFKIIRADGNSQKYLTFRTMFKNFNREDLEVLRSIVKERFKGLQEVTTAQLVLLVYKVAAVFNKVNATKSRVTTAIRVSTAGWIKWIEDQDIKVNEIY
nr:hypothetical protein [Tanacetum cinerariifolium]GEV96866.1 hypothetical protein [Tanacetum cinerariifolium]